LNSFVTSRLETLHFSEGNDLRTLVCEVKKSPRARRIHLRLKSPNSALLTFPKQMSWKAAYRFLRDHFDWLQRKSLEFPRPVSLAEHFSNGGHICLGPSVGERKVEVAIDTGAVGSHVSLENQKITIFFSSIHKQESQLKEACRKLAYQFLPCWLRWAEEKTGLQAKKMRIGDQKTRWGSCSPNGTVSLNWRILLLSQELGDYIIFHELAHLLEMNHSPSFWSKLKEFTPDARLLDRRLSKEGREIFHLGREVG
jgi:predicted metal-dependent hydrolase